MRLYIQKDYDTDLVANIIGWPVVSMEKIGKGKNSRVFRVVCDDLTNFVAKQYIGKTIDGHDRLDTEFSALQFLWNNGVRFVPEPIAADRKNHIAVYEFIDGGEIGSESVTEEEIDQLLGFAENLSALGEAVGSENLYPATESCFTFYSLVENIQGRLNRLYQIPDGGVLRCFLSEDFKPVFNEISRWAESVMRCAGVAADYELPVQNRTLSSSDFGFHNALRSQAGRLIFLDFEYFGWDDPAKLISDFLLHPAMNLNHGLKRQFVQGTTTLFGSDELLMTRLLAVYPMYGLKWVMIFLNEFIPEYLQQRGYTTSELGSIDTLQSRQLAKARKLLSEVASGYKDFPYAI